MALEELTVHGYRGFGCEQSMKFAVPNGTSGSGLTIITGANNSGKSSIIECIRARAGYDYDMVSFTSGKRHASIDAVKIAYRIAGEVETLSSVKPGTSEVVRSKVNNELTIFTLPSRRAFEPFFSRNERSRLDHVMSFRLASQREVSLQNFSSRLFKIQKDPDIFNELVKGVLGYMPEWSIDQSDQGSYYLKFKTGNSSHSSDGVGEGIVSIFAIVDALYDSGQGEVIVIDEPELSLHPALQKRVVSLLEKFSEDRQIVISTHSPYFVRLEAIKNGAHVVRAVKDKSGNVRLFELSGASKEFIGRVVDSNVGNPHLLGLEAREIFFQEDGVILTEGQEDVIFYPKVAEMIEAVVPGALFGWGVGGADNIPHLAKILHDLGFQRVAGILDGDRAAAVAGLQEKFPGYYFAAIPAPDVRTKKVRPETRPVDGLLDENYAIRPEYVDETKRLFSDLDVYMNKGNPGADNASTEGPQKPPLTPATS